MSDYLQIKNLSKQFKGKQTGWRNKQIVQAVDDLSFTIRQGEVLGLVGESGCGKTTLGRTILQLVKPTSGQVILDGTNLAELPAKDLKAMRQRIQIIFQDPYASLNPRMSIGELIRAPLDVFALGSQEEREAKVDGIMEEVGLSTEVKSRYPHEFSGGQLQRVMIARALIAEPEFVVCDEPVSALDASVRAQVLNLLSELQKKRSLTLLFISHDLSVVKHISDRVAVMYLGKIVELTHTDSLYSNPLHPYTQILISSVPTLDKARNKKRRIMKGEIPSPFQIPQGCRFHTRCPYAQDICRSVPPELRDLGNLHWVACHFAENDQKIKSEGEVKGINE